MREALSLITINPAKQLGIENRVGSLEPGKDGDMVIFKRSSVVGICHFVYTLIDGVVKFDREKDADDQRLYVDPKQTIDITDAPVFEETLSHDHDECMKNASSYWM